MKKIALAAAAVAILMTGAVSAADMAVKARPAPVLAYSWTGCYVGGNAGWIEGNDRYDLSIDGSYLLPVNFFSDPRNSGPLAHSYSAHPNRATAGVQAGCNYQTGKLVIGGEADFNWSGLRDSISAAYGSTTIFNGAVVAPRTEVITGKYDWYSTIRGRIGATVISPAFLLYATGGVAIADIQSTTNIAFAPVFQTLGFSTPIGSTSTTRVGWTAGFGGEYAFSGNWSVKAEYLHLDFGTVSYLSPCIQGQPGCSAPAGAWRTNFLAVAETVRVGINYRFGGPVVAKY